MQSIVGMGALFVAACWVIVLLHRIGYDAFDPTRYPYMNGTLTIAYTIVAISVCGVVVFIVARMIR